MLFMFPVIDLTTVGTILELIIQIGQTAAELYILNYLVFEGGWLDMLRLISFWLDTLVIKYIDRFYSYFDKILNGKIFDPAVVERVMNGVFLFVSVIVLFKLIMKLMKYITNPELVTDEKAGGGALVKRVVIGMTLMLFLNTIFDYGFKLQSAILSDNLFGKILLTKGQLNTYEKNKNQMGRVLGFNVYQAFWNLDEDQVGDKDIVNRYEKAVKLMDPSAMGKINEKSGGDYAIDYFPILSTVMLFYVLYLIIKYCIDVVVRMFKLFVLQMLGPIAIADYMIEGDKEGMFKAWTKTTIAAYAMLFMRVFSIWFVAFVTTLMRQECDSTSSACTSLLYIPVDGAGNQQPDYLLRALITLGLLAFLMDLPKLLSEVFGLDLEQDASVKGLMGKVGGAAKMLGLGAVAAGGAAIGGAIGTMKQGFRGVKSQAQLQKAFNKGDITKDQFKKMSKENRSNMNANMSAARIGAMKGLGMGALTAVGAQQVAQSAQQGYGSAEQNVKKSQSNRQEANQTKEQIKGVVASSEKEKQQQQQMDKLDAINLKMGYVAEIDDQMTDVKYKGKVDSLKDMSGYRQNTMLGTLQNMEQSMDKTQKAAVSVSNNVSRGMTYANSSSGSSLGESGVQFDDSISSGSSSESGGKHTLLADGTLTSGGTYDDGTVRPDIPKSEYGVFTTRRDRTNETGMQKRVNDAAHVHDQLSSTELADRVANSAFANVSDDVFRAYQEKAGIFEDKE